MTIDRKVAAEKTQEAVDLSVRTFESTIGRNAEIITQRVSFYDKLIILNGGTLALSFSVASSFHSLTQIKHLLAVSDLLSAWKLLIVSIVLSLLSNWLNLNFIFNMSQRLHVLQKQISDSRMHYAALPLNPTAKFDPLDVSVEGSQARERTERMHRGAFEIAAAFGLISQGATFLAYISLYLFAKANIIS
jgi:hypothetical protein